MEDLKKQIILEKVPNHIAIIMDGNGRWAKRNGKPRIFGHRRGVKTVREITEAAAEIGVGFLTVYAFSTENWNRPPREVNALMGLLVETLRKEIEALNKNNIKLNAIGDLSQLPSKTRIALEEGIKNTASNSKMTLNLALNYSGRWELTRATQLIVSDVQKGDLDPTKITEHTIEQYLTTHNIPDPDLMIRTSGENRISNYLLWQLAYTELYFTDIYWPDFHRKDLFDAIINYQLRERRFGKTSDQLVK